MASSLGSLLFRVLSPSNPAILLCLTIFLIWKRLALLHVPMDLPSPNDEIEDFKNFDGTSLSSLVQHTTPWIVPCRICIRDELSCETTIHRRFVDYIVFHGRRVLLNTLDDPDPRCIPQLDRAHASRDFEEKYIDPLTYYVNAGQIIRKSLIYNPPGSASLRIHVALVVWSDLLPQPLRKSRPTELYAPTQNERSLSMNGFCERIYGWYPPFELPSYTEHKRSTFSFESYSKSAWKPTMNNSKEISDVQSSPSQETVPQDIDDMPPGTFAQPLTRCKVACSFCRKRKIKCNGNDPCNTCQKWKWDCSYPRGALTGKGFADLHR
ncbi:hypothetical protein LY78DRAFT_451546 [Colletotrichum sublineola]|nr:hypothetical protein LY78DRAFT_451546 [Colletotrichum sublineola]